MYSSYMFLSNPSRILASYASGFIASLTGYLTLFTISAISLFPAVGIVSTCKEKSFNSSKNEDLKLKNYTKFI